MKLKRLYYSRPNIEKCETFNHINIGSTKCRRCEFNCEYSRSHILCSNGVEHDTFFPSIVVEDICWNKPASKYTQMLITSKYEVVEIIKIVENVYEYFQTKETELSLPFDIKSSNRSLMTKINTKMFLYHTVSDDCLDEESGLETDHLVLYYLVKLAELDLYVGE